MTVRHFICVTVSMFVKPLFLVKWNSKYFIKLETVPFHAKRNLKYRTKLETWYNFIPRAMFSHIRIIFVHDRKHATEAETLHETHQDLFREIFRISSRVEQRLSNVHAVASHSSAASDWQRRPFDCRRRSQPRAASFRSEGEQQMQLQGCTFYESKVHWVALHSFEEITGSERFVP